MFVNMFNDTPCGGPVSRAHFVLLFCVEFFEDVQARHAPILMSFVSFMQLFSWHFPAVRPVIAFMGPCVCVFCLCVCVFVVRRYDVVDMLCISVHPVPGLTPHQGPLSL